MNKINFSKKNQNLKNDDQFSTKISQLGNLLNYTFSSIKWVSEALTRQSAITERHPNASTKNYQRLEFLGDSVLNLAVSDLIYEMFPDKKEEDLHPLRSFIVKNDTLGQYALKLNLGRFLIMGKGEEHQNIRSNRNIMADVTEALIGAIFIDSGRNYDITKNVILNFLKPVFYSDKNYIEYTNNLNFYFDTKLKPILRPKLPEFSNIIDIDMSDSNSSFLNLTKIDDLLEINNSHYNSQSLNIISYLSSIEFDQIKEFFTSQKLFISNEEVDLKIDKFIHSKQFPFYHFIEYDLLMINSNENFIPLIKNNLNLTEIIIQILQNKIKFTYENLQIKEHFFLSKLLLNFIINLGDDISDFYNISIFCLLHNGISDFYRNHFKTSKNFFEKVLDSINMLENDCEIIKNSDLILEIKCLSINYISEISFITNDILTLNDSVKLINTISLYQDNSLVQLQKVFVKNYILNNKTSNQINEVIDKYFNQMNKLDKIIMSSKLYLEEIIEMKIVKYKLNQNMKDLSEFKELEFKVNEKCGKDSYLFVMIFKLYIDKLNEEFEKNQNFSTLEKIMIYMQKIIKILFVNFNVNDKILIDNLNYYQKLLDDYINFN